MTPSGRTVQCLVKRLSWAGAVTVVTDKLGDALHKPTTGSGSCLCPRLCPLLLSR
jgi:hypothetical protein